MLINGKQIGTNSEPITLAPDEMNTNDRTGETNMEQGNDKVMQIIQRVLPELLQRIEKLEAKVNGTEEDQDDTKQLSEDDDAVAFLLSGGSNNDASEDAAVDQLLAFNKKRREDG